MPNIGEPAPLREQFDLDDPDMEALAWRHPHSDIGRQFWDDYSQRALERIDSAFAACGAGRSSSPGAPPDSGAGSYEVRRPPARPVGQFQMPVTRPVALRPAPPPGFSPAASSNEPGAYRADPSPGTAPAASTLEPVAWAPASWAPNLRPPAPISRPFGGLIPPQRAPTTPIRPFQPSAPAHGTGPYAPSSASETAGKGKGRSLIHL